MKMNACEELNRLAGMQKFQFDKNKVPGSYKCDCSLTVDWYWLDSDCKELFPSRWMKHLCLCEIIRHLTICLNRANTQKETLKREIEDNKRTRKYSLRQLEKLTDISGELELYITEKDMLLKAVVGLKKSSDPNQMYYNIRADLAKEFNAWKELFECKSEEETIL